MKENEKKKERKKETVMMMERDKPWRERLKKVMRRTHMNLVESIM